MTKFVLEFLGAQDAQLSCPLPPPLWMHFCSFLFFLLSSACGRFQLTFGALFALVAALAAQALAEVAFSETHWAAKMDAEEVCE